MRMTRLLRWLGGMLLVLAIAAMLILLAGDIFSALKYTPLHRHAGALSFLLIGASYLAILLSRKAGWGEKWKGLLLAIGFVFWGCAQLLPPSAWVTAMDSAVVLIFVSDLSAVIVSSLRREPKE